MRKVWLCIFYALCIFTIVFSLFWMALPSLPFPADSGEETPASEPGLAAQAPPGRAAPTSTSATRVGGWSSTPAPTTDCPTSGSCAPASMSIFCLRPMPSGSSRASTSPAKRPSGRCWKTWVNKRKQCRRSPGRSALFFILDQNQASSCSSGTR